MAEHRAWGTVPGIVMSRPLSSTVQRFLLVFVALAVAGWVFLGPRRDSSLARWPSLASIASVAGRPATWEDVHEGRAAISFVYDGQHRGQPIEDVTIPQYAWSRITSQRQACILIQAELDADRQPIYGLLDLQSGRPFACRPDEVILIGNQHP